MLKPTAAALLVAALAGCHAVKPPVTTTQITHAVDCTRDQIEQQIPALITEVTTDLLDDDYTHMLNQLGAKVGDDVLVCTIQASAASADARKSEAAGDSPNADVVMTNADAYLKLRGVTFVPIPRPGSARNVPRGTSVTHPRSAAQEEIPMGTWNISIKGQGIHHNHRPDDANVLAAKFVQQLKDAGHVVTDAKFELTAQMPPADDIAAPDYAASAGPPDKAA